MANNRQTASHRLRQADAEPTCSHLEIVRLLFRTALAEPGCTLPCGGEKT